MKSSEHVAELYSALIAAAAKLTNPKKTKRVNAGQRSYGYPELDQIVDHVRETFAGFGLAALQETVTSESGVGVVTRFIHSSGEWLEMGPFWIPSGNTAQEHGSALTYARRYALTAALLLAAEEDDDGAKASKRETSAQASAITTPRVEEEAGSGKTSPAKNAEGGPASQPVTGSGEEAGGSPASGPVAHSHRLKKSQTDPNLFNCQDCTWTGTKAEAARLANVKEAVG